MLEEARKRCDSAELYSSEKREDHISFENGNLKNIESTVTNGYGMRMIRDGRMGFSFTTNMKNVLIENCYESMKAGSAARFSLPRALGTKKVNSFDPQLNGVDNEEIAKECDRVLDELSEGIKAQVDFYARRIIKKITVSNTEGAELSQELSYLVLQPIVYYPNSTASIGRAHISVGFEHYPQESLDFLCDMWSAGKRKTEAGTGLKEVLFLPEEVSSLLLSLTIATNGKNVCEGKSPLADRRGQAIFDEKIGVYNDPLDDRFAGARSFDDEGVPCRRLPIVEKGVLRNFYYDLDWASRACEEPTGNGLKRELSSKPEPLLDNLSVSPGSKALEDMIAEIDDGIIVCGTLGNFVGNLYKGDFSMGVAPALVVKAGEIKGRAGELMVSGNLYEVMKDVTAVESKIHPTWGGNFPAILLREVNVS